MSRQRVRPGAGELLVLALVMCWEGFGPAVEPALAEDAALAQPIAGLEAAAEAPTPDDVRRMIEGLGSVRDYDRMHWVLAGIEQQVPQMRAELLKSLYDRVQRLLDAEVELRTASAVASLTPILGGHGQDREQDVQVTVSKPTDGGEGARTSQASPPMEQRPLRASWVEPQEFEAIQNRIEQLALMDDLGQRMTEVTTLAKLIQGVEGLEQQQALHRLLRQQFDVVAQRQAERRQQEVESLLHPDRSE